MITQQDVALPARHGLLGFESPAFLDLDFPSEAPEYAGIDEKYMTEERKLEAYRNQCKDEVFQLFSQWFFHLWD